MLRGVHWCGRRRRRGHCRGGARGVGFALEELSEKSLCGTIGRIRVVDEILDHFALPLLTQTLNKRLQFVLNTGAADCNVAKLKLPRQNAVDDARRVL